MFTSLQYTQVETVGLRKAISPYRIFESIFYENIIGNLVGFPQEDTNHITAKSNCVTKIWQEKPHV